ncbi:uncharacterized protein ASCRUDRAFT_68152 [Ascoidea rubescens DSM 1968]|uniref:Uncharacterized protein n=1 Tax=Ascoidea rubescens DSM 1968 TaxID=1344418 RepID=A0A1D2VRA5_9ASCO|nr:hypothetical protein ASCRUDRAFT_68152 [Ascoidea rubescens DSM 1968]ODV64130.1 hypothetical protein ASCRUDRAFT_68152 [Ascoidea rubescens DSM 1968]
MSKPGAHQQKLVQQKPVQHGVGQYVEHSDGYGIEEDDGDGECKHDGANGGNVNENENGNSTANDDNGDEDGDEDTSIHEINLSDISVDENQGPAAPQTAQTAPAAQTAGWVPMTQLRMNSHSEALLKECLSKFPDRALDLLAVVKASVGRSACSKSKLASLDKRLQNTHEPVPTFEGFPTNIRALAEQQQARLTHAPVVVGGQTYMATAETPLAVPDQFRVVLFGSGVSDKQRLQIKQQRRQENRILRREKMKKRNKRIKLQKKLQRQQHQQQNKKVGN